MVQFAYVDVYYGLGWKKKYHAPTDFGFALKVIDKGLTCISVSLTATN